MKDNKYTGINIQYPISELILTRKKIIETRTYPIPEKYLNKELLLIETPGKEGKFKARITAIIKFTECFKYQSKKEFYSDTNRHCVTQDSAWAWKNGEKWGWKVEVISKFKTPLPAPLKKGIKFTLNIYI